MERKPLRETFNHHLERMLAANGLQPYGHNEFDQDAEQACYQKAVDCFYPAYIAVAHVAKGFPHHWLLNQYPNGAPLPADTPPWGIHAMDPEEAPHGAALAGDMASRLKGGRPITGALLFDGKITFPPGRYVVSSPVPWTVVGAFKLGRGLL